MSEIKNIQIKEIKVRDLPVITKYFNETGLKSKLETIIFPKEDLLVTTWAELREEANLSLEELNDVKTNTGGDLVLALKTTSGAEHLAPKEMTQQELSHLIFETIYDVIDDERIYNLTVGILAYLYEIDKEEVEDMSLKEMKEAIMGAIESQDFL